MKIVEFKFDDNQRVKTALGDEGIISMLGIQNGIKKYFVDLKGGTSNWYNEDQLTAVE